MSSKTLSGLLRAAVAASGLCALYIALTVIPSLGKSIIELNPEFAHWYWPWLIFCWLVSLPCFAILGLVWKASGAIRDETIFTLKTAKLIKAGAILLFCDAGFFFTGNVVLSLLGMNHPGILLASLLGDIFAVALAVFASILARYVTKAAELQEMSDGTV